MKTAVIALSLALLILVACAPQHKAVTPSVPVAQPPVSQPVTQPVTASGVAEVDGFSQDLSDLDKLDADLNELETI